MTINVGNLNPWQAYQQQAQQTQSGQASSTSSNTNGVQNSTTTDLNSGFQAYLQAFALDMQASGMQGSGSTTNTGTINGSGTLQPGGHHHHDDSTQTATNGVTGATTQILQGVSQAAGGVLTAAGGTANMAAQALSAYAAASPAGALLAGIGA